MRRLLKILLWIMGIWAALTILLEIVLSSSFLTKNVNRFASEYIDGEIRFGRVSASMFRKFPSVLLEMEDLAVTYPSERFDTLEAAGPQGHLLYGGCGEEADTLASFKRFAVGVNPWALLTGKIAIPEIELVKPRIFAHSYIDGSANWDLLGTTDRDTAGTENSTSDKKLPRIDIGRIRLSERPHIVYTDSRDTVFAMIDIRRIGFDGRLTTGRTSRNRIGLSADSLFLAGRIAADTVAVGLDRLHIHEHRRHLDFSAEAKALAATRSFGRMQIPVSLSGTLHFPKDTVTAIALHGLKAEIAAVPLEGDVHVRLMEGKTGIDGRIAVTGCKVNDVTQNFLCNFIPEAADISTDAVISVEAVCRDEYIHGSGTLPQCRLNVRLPEASLTYKGFPQPVHLALEADAESIGDGKVNVGIGLAKIRTTGLDFNAAGGAEDVLSGDPLLKIDGSLEAELSELSAFLPDTSGVVSEGALTAGLQGQAKLSDLNIYRFSQSELTGNIASDRILFKAPSDSIDISVNGLKAVLGPDKVTSKRDTNRTFTLMGITGGIENADIEYKDKMSLHGKNVTVSAKTSTNTDLGDTTRISRMGGYISADELSVTDASGASVRLTGTTNGFQMMPKKDNHKIPELTFTSTNKHIYLTTDDNRAILTDATIKAGATMNSIERKQLRKTRLDSLQRVYPDVPRDSLMRHAMRNRPARELPAWMTEEDFRKQDISITIDQSIAKYFREWDLNGSVKVRTGILMTPYFPLRNILRGCEVTFDNDRIGIDSLKVMSGSSNISAKGELKGLRRVLTGRKGLMQMMKLNLSVSTDKMDANELLAAYNAGSNFDPEEAEDEMAEATDAEFLKMVIQEDTSEVEEPMKLIVIPANLDADMTLDGNGIRYSDLEISDFKANLLMKERCVQITNTMATSNIGDISFEGFYATRTKKDIKAGFNFNFKDITAEKAISLIPAVDTIMPLLKSFAGKLNCDLAATADLDTNMNVITPTINGVIRISGNDLTISDSDMFTSLAKKLKFNNNKVGKIKQMTVEGVIKENMLEVFPFVISLDRYTLALSGKQNLDLSYRYHASLIRSPMLIKVGVDLYGPDFDHMKFKIGKPKYKNENVPVFTAVIDQTRINLAESIRNIFVKGVDAAVMENAKQAAIMERKEELGYTNAVDQELEALSEEEQKQLESSPAEGNPAEENPITTTEETSNNIQE